MTKETFNSVVAVCSSPAHVGFLPDGTWEGLAATFIWLWISPWTLHTFSNSHHLGCISEVEMFLSAAYVSIISSNKMLHTQNNTCKMYMRNGFI